MSLQKIQKLFFFVGVIIFSCLAFFVFSYYIAVLKKINPDTI